MKRYRSNPLVDDVMVIGFVAIGALVLVNYLKDQPAGAINRALYPNVPFTPQGYADWSGATGGWVQPPKQKPWWCFVIPPGPGSLAYTPIGGSVCQ